MKITLDIDQLLQERCITQEEYDRLKSLASRDTSSLALNILIGFGVIAVAGGTLALLESAAASIPLGMVLAGFGVYLGIVYPKQWKLLGGILLLIGSLTAAGGIIALTKGSAAGFLVVTLLCVVGAILAKSGLLAALSVLALLSAVGGMTGYGHAMYFLCVEQPALTVVLFGILSVGAYLISLQLPLDYARIAVSFSRTALFVVNLGFWIGSLWGDSLWHKRQRFNFDKGTMIPDLVFVVGWAVGLIAVGVWAAKRNKRWVVNLIAVFGAIHFYTQWFERMGASPGTIVTAGLIAIGIAVALTKYNRAAKTNVLGHEVKTD